MPSASMDLNRLRAGLGDELVQSQEELRLATEQHDRLCADINNTKEQFAQLQAGVASHCSQILSELSAANNKLKDRLGGSNGI